MNHIYKTAFHIRRLLIGCLILFCSITARSQQDVYILLKPEQLFDGETMHKGWNLLIKNNIIDQVGPVENPPANAKTVLLPHATLLPGLIEGHAHLFLHPYNEASWNDQVLKESRAERTARAANHAKATLMAGFTCLRDLGTEGCFYDDVGLKTAIEKEIISGPRMIVATRAIVAKGTYGPRFNNPEVVLPQGAAEVGNEQDLIAEVRNQIGRGADVVKIYADYRWGLNGTAAPTFTTSELSAAVEIASSGGRHVVVHASTIEGMKRAIAAGVSTIEHGDQGTKEIFEQMKVRHVAFCPTLAATEAIASYNGWKKNIDADIPSILQKKKAFTAALNAGVTICMGGDVGVFSHGNNAREMELMVEYGMKPINVLQSATSVNADVFGLSNQLGRLRKGLLADVIAVTGDPSVNISDIRKNVLIIKGGKFYKTPFVDGK